MPENSNTALVRNQISCQSLITVSTATDGSVPDASYVYRLSGPSADRSGILNANDTLRIDGIPPGGYTVDLGHVSGTVSSRTMGAPGCSSRSPTAAAPRPTSA